MEYINPPVPEGIYSDDRSPLREFFLRGGMTVGVFALCLLVLGWIASLAAPFVPFSWEERAAARFFPETPPGPDDQELRRLAARLSAAMDLPEGMRVTVHYNPGATVNAFAAPGGHIVVFRGILERLGSEDELAMLLAHEIAHVKHRDVIRGTLRGLGVMLLMAGVESVGPVLGGVEQMGALSFSRGQEDRADREATAAVARLYGHTGGAIRLFETLRQAVYGNKRELPELVSSHPDFAHRIARTRAQSRELGRAESGELTPLAAVLGRLRSGKE